MLRHLASTFSKHRRAEYHFLCDTNTASLHRVVESGDYSCEWAVLDAGFGSINETPAIWCREMVQSINILDHFCFDFIHLRKRRFNRILPCTSAGSSNQLYFSSEPAHMARFHVFQCYREMDLFWNDNNNKCAIILHTAWRERGVPLTELLIISA